MGVTRRRGRVSEAEGSERVGTNTGSDQVFSLVLPPRLADVEVECG